jgi:hypothetical protein
VQSEKQYSPITSTDDGIIIDVNPLPMNASSSIRLNREFEAIGTDTNDWQQEK